MPKIYDVWYCTRRSFPFEDCISNMKFIIGNTEQEVAEKLAEIKKTHTLFDSGYILHRDWHHSFIEYYKDNNRLIDLRNNALQYLTLFD